MRGCGFGGDQFESFRLANRTVLPVRARYTAVKFRKDNLSSPNGICLQPRDISNVMKEAVTIDEIENAVPEKLDLSPTGNKLCLRTIAKDVGSAILEVEVGAWGRRTGGGDPIITRRCRHYFDRRPRR
jgi:hypothetical protein